MAARKRWRRYIPDDEISVRAFLHLIGRLFYYVGLHSEYFLLNFGRGARAAVLALWHGVCWMLAVEKGRPQSKWPSAGIRSFYAIFLRR